MRHPTRSPLIIEGQTVVAGSRQTLEIQLPLLYTHTQVMLSMHIVHGFIKGPTLFVSGAVHGDEINGVEIIRRLLQMPILRDLRGTLIAVPVVNVYGFVRQSRYLPDRRDLNRMFPGSERGSLAARLAHSFIQIVVKNSTHGIDLHTGALHRDNLPQIRAAFKPETVEEHMAKAFAAPIIMNSEMRDGSLREAAAEIGVPVIVYEGGEALRFDELAIRTGVRGIVGVMRALKMFKSPRNSGMRMQQNSLVAKSSTWVRAPQSGILRANVPLGVMVEKNERLGFITDPLGEQEEEVIAHTAGMVIGKVNLPLVNEGEAIYHIARLDSEEESNEFFDYPANIND
ncbi:succinylglutamate desuccinylase [Achromatium sp. WMS2]|nr:succinylglutamate desuccinylase [Achromatium sp. WMS2]